VKEENTIPVLKVIEVEEKKIILNIVTMKKLDITRTNITKLINMTSVQDLHLIVLAEL
jgi:hypothetical protein